MEAQVYKIDKRQAAIFMGYGGDDITDRTLVRKFNAQLRRGRVSSTIRVGKVDDIAQNRKIATSVCDMACCPVSTIVIV
jgi:hypothetical protein